MSDLTLSDLRDIYKRVHSCYYDNGYNYPIDQFRSDVRELVMQQQIATLRQELATARDSRKRLVNVLYALDELLPPATRFYNNLKMRLILQAHQLGFQLSMAEAQRDTAKDELSTAEAALAAALQREQQLREALRAASTVRVLNVEHGNYYRCKLCNGQSPYGMTSGSLVHAADCIIAAPADAQVMP